MNIWEVSHLAVMYPSRDGGTQAFLSVDLVLPPGDVVVLHGPSGSGKSSLLYCLAGLLKPTAGTLKYLGEDVAPWSEHQWSRLRRRDVSFVPQTPAVISYLTVAETLGNGSASTISREAENLADRLDIVRYRTFFPHQLSLGGRYRLSLARALLNNGVSLLLDEPTASLDDAMTAVVLDECRRAADRGASVFIATHDPRVAGPAIRHYRLFDGKVEEFAL